MIQDRMRPSYLRYMTLITGTGHNNDTEETENQEAGGKHLTALLGTEVGEDTEVRGQRNAASRLLV